MELRELKDRIRGKKLISLPLAFIDDNSSFLVDEYIRGIADCLHLKPRTITSVGDIDDRPSMFIEDDSLLVYRAERGVVVDSSIAGKCKLIVIYEKEPEGNDLDTVVFSKPEQWMIEDYASTRLPGLDKEEVAWLCKVCNYDIYRIGLECDKLALFDKKEQERMFELINEEDGYCDLSDYRIFDITNAILKRDNLSLKRVMKDISAIDVEPTGLITILIKNFYLLINIQMGKNPTAKSLGVSEKQLQAVKYKSGNWSNEELIRIYEFLNAFDARLKSGYADMDNETMIQYLVDNILQ